MSDRWKRVSKRHRKLWILLREKLINHENNEKDPEDKEVYHFLLTEMAQMEAKRNGRRLIQEKRR
ncbi:MAG TPA: hypothetical protein DDW53_20490 [Lachnoclostridium sp.]|uniref:Uncharacterized protein n=1 Tax=[Clostridium] celerecrescens 18A TaxID=1286362 RepID=A0A2M8Z5M2_9FIRM|nr:hypothetical protein H171_2267 [[Clostridium] celerecrescens 18A]HBE87209.1 hypothetical protein [Lachnoclostridium sp.]